MMRDVLARALDEISPDYIAQAALYKKPKVRAGRHILRAAAMLLVCFGMAFAADRLASPDKQTVEPIVLIEYNDAYYEVIDNTKALRRLGLGGLAPEEAAGEQVTYLAVPTDGGNYLPSDTPTEARLLEYAPAPGQGVYIMQIGEEYSYVRICNLINTEGAVPAADALALYGIYSGDDLASVTPVSPDNRWRPKGRAVTDEAQLCRFYQLLTPSRAYTFDEYHSAVYGPYLAEAEADGQGDVGGELYAARADELHRLMVETKDGLRFEIDYYPGDGWMYISSGMSYYPISSDMSAWLADNIQ